MMDKTEFMKALEARLSKASPEERVAALQYYGEYLDEAGPELEAQVLAELGSPDKVAGDILASLGISGEAADAPAVPAPASNAASGPPPAAEPAPVLNFPPLPPLPALRGQGTYPPPPTGNGATAGTAPPPPQYNQRNSSVAKIILIVLACIFLAPILGGLLVALICLLIALFFVFLVPLIVGVALVASGVAVAISGIAAMAISVPSALVNLGIGILMLGLGLLAGYGGVRLLAKALPAIVRAVASGIGKLFKSIFK